MVGVGEGALLLLFLLAKLSVLQCGNCFVQSLLVGWCRATWKFDKGLPLGYLRRSGLPPVARDTVII